MKKLRALYVSIVALLTLSAATAIYAQTTEEPPPAGTPVTMAVYYKVPPGKPSSGLPFTANITTR